MSPLLGWLACAAAVAGWVATVAGQRARAERLARLVHDVRGPLTALGLALHGAAPGSRNGPAAREAALRAAEGQLGRARGVLDELQACALGRPATGRPETIDVDGLLFRELAAWEPVARAAGAELRLADVAPGAAVVADGPRLVRVTSNLIANALEHGGGDVRLSARRAGGRVRIEVQDDGGPVRPQPPDRFRPRRGRGLAIAAEIAARHGGELVVDGAHRHTAVGIELPDAGGPG